MQNSGVTPELKSLKKRAPANKNHKVKAEKESCGFFREMSSHCIGVLIGSCSKRFGGKLLCRRNGDDHQRQECALLDNAGYAADCPGGRAGGQVVWGAVFFLAKYRQKAKFKIKISKKN